MRARLRPPRAEAKETTFSGSIPTVPHARPATRWTAHPESRTRWQLECQSDAAPLLANTTAQEPRETPRRRGWSRRQTGGNAWVSGASPGQEPTPIPERPPTGPETRERREGLPRTCGVPKRARTTSYPREVRPAASHPDVARHQHQRSRLSVSSFSITHLNLEMRSPLVCNSAGGLYNSPRRSPRDCTSLRANAYERNGFADARPRGSLSIA